MSQVRNALPVHARPWWMQAASPGRRTAREQRKSLGLWHIVKTGWSLVGPRERRGAISGLLLFCVSALGASLMVGLMFPFPAILADPSRIADMAFVTDLGTALGLKTPYEYLQVLGALTIAVILASSALLIRRSFFITRYCEHFVYRLGRRLLQHYLAQPNPFFLDRHSGDLAKNILSEADQVSAMYLRPVADLAASAITVAAVVAMLVAIDPANAGIGLLTITTFYAGLPFLCRHLAGRLGEARMAANGFLPVVVEPWVPYRLGCRVTGRPKSVQAEVGAGRLGARRNDQGAAPLLEAVEPRARGRTAKIENGRPQALHLRRWSMPSRSTR
jgi:ABC-type multidrug transport system fused ATPase/permease subunit